MSGSLLQPSSLPYFLIPSPLLVMASPLDSLAPVVSSSSFGSAPATSSVWLIHGLAYRAFGPCLHLGLSARHHHLHSPFPHRLHCLSSRKLRWATSLLQVSLRWSTLSFRHGLPGFRLRGHPAPLRCHRAPPFLQPPRHPCLLQRRPGHSSPRRCRLSPASQQLKC